MAKAEQRAIEPRDLVVAVQAGAPLEAANDDGRARVATPATGVRSTEPADALLGELFEAPGGLKLSELVEVTGVRRRTCSDRLKRLAEEGQIVKLGSRYYHPEHAPTSHG